MRYMPILWLTVLTIAMAIGQAHAAPPCFYGDANSDEPGALTPHIYYDWANLGIAPYWFCDGGHQWITVVGATAKMSEFNYTTASAAVISAVTPEQKQALADRIEAAAAPTAYDEQLIAAVFALPKPTKAPPSGLVTQTVFAYRLNTSNASLSIVGTVPLGTPCDATQSINGLYRIDRTKVKFPAGTLMPPTTWAKCTQ